MKKYTLFGFLLIILAVGCRKSLEETTSVDSPHTPVIIDNYTPSIENITSSVIGTVVDEAGEFVAGAGVSFGGSFSVTNAFGIFEFKNVPMNKLGTFIQIDKDGYFSTGRRFYPVENETSLVRIEMIETSFSQNFESSAGGTIELENNGGSIVFYPNSIQNSAGEIYNGTVQIATTWLDPSDLNTLNQMPGALEGVNAANEEVGLATYGMIGVELQDSNGEPLNIAEGFTAEININVPASLQSTAPSEIPLWSFNYTYGIWVEEGSALLQNGTYVGEVSHFSFWNCDVPLEVVNFEAYIVEENSSSPMANVLVKISLINGAASGSAFSDPKGFVSGPIPKNENLLLEVFSPCGDVLHSEAIGPFSADISFGEIAIMATASTQISGEILDCDGELVNTGFVILKYDGQSVTHFVDSNPFSFTTILCNSASQMDVIGVDFDALIQGDPVTIPIGNNINVGSLAACGQPLLGTFKMTVDGTTRYFLINSTPQLPDTITPFITYLSMFSQPNPPGDTLLAQIILNNPGGAFPFPTGDFSGDNNGIDIIIDSANGWNFSTTSSEPGFDVFVVEEYGLTTGTLISGYMSGTMINKAGGLNIPTFVEAEFSAIRSQ